MTATTRYARPTTTRRYDEIQADITEAVSAMARNDSTGADYWRRDAEYAQRLTNLWNEIVFQAVDDEALPHWTRFAALGMRDHYADLVREACREAAQREESTRGRTDG